MKNITKFYLSSLLFLLALSSVAVVGCRTSKPTPNPLAGWKIVIYQQPDQTITKDYQEYIQNLPAGESKYAGVSNYFEDGTGQHAIVIELALRGTWWNHVLIYDKNDKRVKAIIYSAGKYSS